MKHASNLPTPHNELVQEYVPGSVQRSWLKAVREVLADARLPGVHFPGSTSVFCHGVGVASAQHVFAWAGLITMISVPKSNAGRAMARSS